MKFPVADQLSRRQSFSFVRLQPDPSSHLLRTAPALNKNLSRAPITRLGLFARTNALAAIAVVGHAALVRVSKFLGSQRESSKCAERQE